MPKSGLRTAAFAFAAAVLGLAAPTHAVPFTTTYTFAGSPGNQASEAVDAGSVPAGLTFSALTRGSGITAQPLANSISSSNFTNGALDLVDYYGLTITPDALTNFGVTQLVAYLQRTSVGPQSIAIRTSLDNFASNVGSVASLVNTSLTQVTFNFGAAFANLTSPLTIRIYGFDASNSGAMSRLSILDGPGSTPGLSVSGSVEAAVVPEPASVLLTGLGLVGLVAAVRRRASASA